MEAGMGTRSEASEKTCGKMLTKADDFTLRAGTSAQESISESLQVLHRNHREQTLITSKRNQS